MRYYRIVDECYWEHFIAVPDDCDVLLAPHTRKAECITREEYEEHQKIKCERRETE